MFHDSKISFSISKFKLQVDIISKTQYINRVGMHMGLEVFMGEDYTNYLLGSKEHYTKYIFIIMEYYSEFSKNKKNH